MVETRKKQIAEYRANIPDKHNGAYHKKYDMAMKRKSMAAAVRMKCLDCMCWQMSEVTHCTVYSCPLHAYRPGSKKSDTPA